MFVVLVLVLGGSEDAGFGVGVPAVDDGVAGFEYGSGRHGYVEGGLQGCGCCEEEYQVEEMHGGGIVCVNKWFTPDKMVVNTRV